jgi:hypothetical protein
MQTSSDRNNPDKINDLKQPSLLRQIVDKVDEGAKKLLLLTLSQEELTEKYKKLDSKISKSGEILGEKKIDKLVSNTRKKMYEQKIRS